MNRILTPQITRPSICMTPKGTHSSIWLLGDPIAWLSRLRRWTWWKRRIIAQFMGWAQHYRKAQRRSLCSIRQTYALQIYIHDLARPSLSPSSNDSRPLIIRMPYGQWHTGNRWFHFTFPHCSLRFHFVGATDHSKKHDLSGLTSSLHERYEGMVCVIERTGDTIAWPGSL